ncbi:hypothetical protein B6D60_03245 [candidate division KSB1 bacterium 4484_87]|nr:MAG: hypothetical protein B6D60_03245 [candidate division KSB1 bacterium 4484_87]
MEVGLERIVNWKKKNIPFCVITVVDAKGATPRKSGARAIVFPDGKSEGTVGGGSIEVQAFRDALDALQAGVPVLKEYLLEELETGKMVCGGKMTLFFEPILPDKRLTIFGGGHVGRAVANVANEAGWRVRVVDEREQILDQVYFPEDCELIETKYEEFLEKNEISPNDWLVIVTPQHTKDAVVLEAVISSPARYIGAMGSPKKIRELKEYLLSKGISEKLFEKVHAPIGLNIGTETPGEIAVAIVAEMLAVQQKINEVHACSGKF